MKPAATFAAAIAVATLMAAAALANDNASYLSQEGGGNSASVDQSAGDRNHSGADGLAIRQHGDDNILGFTQLGKGNRIGAAGTGFLQESNRNSATVVQSSDRNVVREVTQTGNGSDAGSLRRNTLSIVQQGGAANSVHTLIQTRAGGLASGLRGNEAAIVQTGAGNRIGLLSQTGRANGADLAFIGNVNLADSIQSGASNAAVMRVDGNLNVLRLDQDSNLLGNAAAIRIDDGNLNLVQVRQSGANAAGVTIHGDLNLVSVDQSGANLAAVSVDGRVNRVTASQSGTGNVIDVAIAGDGNNILPFASGPVGTLADAAGLAPGDIAQSGLFNSINYNLGMGGLSNGNRFAFRQQGFGNRIEGITDGSNNQVVVVQQGTFGFTSFVQVGNANIIAVNQ